VKYSFQAELARKLGAEFVIDSGAEDVMTRVGEIAETKIHPLASGALLAGRVRLVYDTITSTGSINQALRMARGKGTIVIVGLPAAPHGVDWTPIVCKELTLIGSMTYGDEIFARERASTFARALQFTSGLMVFARNQFTQAILQQNWKKVAKKYLAVVEGAPATGQGTLKDHLVESNSFI